MSEFKVGDKVRFWSGGTACNGAEAIVTEVFKDNRLQLDDWNTPLAWPQQCQLVERPKEKVKWALYRLTSDNVSHHVYGEVRAFPCDEAKSNEHNWKLIPGSEWSE